MSCALCKLRKEKRFCPAVHDKICPVCCGQEREVSLDCPSECVYLQEARKHERRGLKDLPREALEELEAFYTFQPDQQKWLTFIAEHLKTNLSISEEDLESQPVFTDRGGLARARKLFGNDLRGVIDRLNYTMVAA